MDQGSHAIVNAKKESLLHDEICAAGLQQHKCFWMSEQRHSDLLEQKEFVRQDTAADRDMCRRSSIGNSGVSRIGGLLAVRCLNLSGQFVALDNGVRWVVL
ncbi:hypothetical protein NDU88_004835 [Pleurodeles waltl]|uniref:Uncharacterized protein n=1 Tax=Pleurodeles waltl TaxID=8319 RepID=A0AAV7RKF3_PLEWA|nr:hypothetical protein NDU88_004835 [Pleurodeles waltl]